MSGPDAPWPTPPRTEHRLLLAAAADPLGSIAVEHRALPIDWTYLVEMVLHHRLVPPLAAMLAAGTVTGVPPELGQALNRLWDFQRAQHQLVLQELFALLDAFESRGVRAIPYKGPLLGEVLFGDVSLRSPGDIDLLFAAEDIGAARAVLEARQYVDAGRGVGAEPLTPVQQELYERFQCEYQFVRESDDMVVEPHWELSQWPLAIDVDYSGMLRRAVAGDSAGRRVLMLAPEDLLVALCVHGGKHRWMRLTWIRDVAAILRRFPTLDLAGVLRRAAAGGYERIVLLGLCVAADNASASLPPAVIDRAGRDRTLRALRRAVRDGLFEPVSEPRNERVDRFRWRMRERTVDRLRYAVRTIVTPRRHHLETVALPRELRWGYHVIRVGIDFAMLPVWRLLKRTKSNVRATN